MPERETRVDRGLQPDVHAGLAQRLEHLLARERLVAREQSVASMDERHLRAEARPGLCHLDADDASAEDREPPRDLASRSSPLDSSTASRRAVRGCPGTRAVDPVATTTALRATSVSSPTTTRRSPSIRPWPRISVTSFFSSHGSWAESSKLWLASSRRANTAATSIGASVRPGTRPHLVRQVDGPEQGLRRHARVERALPADELLLDQRDRDAVLVRAAPPSPRPPGRRRGPPHRTRARSSSGRPGVAGVYAVAMTASHPLDPLSADEIIRAVSVARTAPGPVRAAPLRVGRAARAGQGRPTWPGATAALARPARRSSCCSTPAPRAGSRWSISLDDDRLVSRDVLPADVQPAIHGDEFMLAGRRRPRRPALRRGPARSAASHPSLVHVEAWTSGDVRGPRSARLVRGDRLARQATTRRQPVRATPVRPRRRRRPQRRWRSCALDDHAPGAAVADGRRRDYRDGGGRPYRPDLRRSRSRSPTAPASALDGQPGRLAEVGPARSGSIRARASCCTTSAYTDAGERRQICHRASIAELVIPYGDPNPTVHFKNVFDTGEYGMGPMTNSLELGLRLPRRDPLPRRRHEQPDRRSARDPERDLHPRGGRQPPLEAHDTSAGRVDRARSRRLVISSIATVGNYEYGYFWYFYQDASFAFEAKLTGIVHTAGWVSDERSPHSLPIGDGRRHERPPALLLRPARPRHRRHA